MGLLNTPEMKPTPRNQLLGLLADALTMGRDFADRAKVPDVVPLLGGQGLGSLLLGKAPEELTDISYGNMPVRINPLAGRTASFVPEIKPGRKEQVADLAMALQAVPGGNRAALGALGAVDTGANKAAIVWHGSPHKFDAFDASKIGTGEGAQAYGHGLYLAESPGVARQYAENVKDMGAVQRINAELSQLSKIMASDEVPGSYRKYRTDAGREAAKRYDELMASRESVRQAPGQMYKVDLPDEKIARMLDWDKPLSQQAPEVRKAIDAASESPMLRHLSKSNFGGDVDTRGLLDRLSRAWRRDYGVGGEPEVVDVLRQSGIPGIRYLDQGSRGAGQGTSNFVVFPGEESALRILERNGGLLAP